MSIRHRLLRLPIPAHLHFQQQLGCRTAEIRFPPDWTERAACGAVL